jgi:hypothetical protein
MRKLLATLFFVLIPLTPLAVDANTTTPAKLESGGSPAAEPQTKCEKGFVNVQFKGEQEWFQTTKKCSARTANVKRKLDTTHASRQLTETQLDVLLTSFQAGNPQPQQNNVCCCQPGWQVYDSTTHKCRTDGVVINKQTGKPD